MPKVLVRVVLLCRLSWGR